MKSKTQRVLAAALLLAMSPHVREAVAQAAPSAAQEQSPPVQSLPSPSVSTAPETLPSVPPGPSPLSMPPEVSPLQPLLDFKDSDVKFSPSALMNTLRDSRHEGWVLAAYPDPKTSRPLIGAGFSLDVEAMQHIQRDPFNPYPFIEPSAAQLWQAAGFDTVRLQSILDQYDRDLKKWKKKNFRRKIKTHQLPPQLTEAEAMRLLRISTIQAIHNARAYCRNFDQLTASQQMALSQLVYQMGVNLEEFVQFLTALNDSYPAAAQPQGSIESESEHWKTVQLTLIQSQWARRYSTRAVTVIAMFAPDYAQDPRQAEREVQAKLHPPVHHRKKSRAQPA